ncbi:MAG: efflux RND transporter permease subunit, partial [bacterium]|nr:efflux RND transporter permease subunit [bacterium]
GETAGGIVVMRYGENALATIDRIKERLEQLKAGLPEGVQIVPVYDRSGLIQRAVDTLKEKLLEELLVVALVCVVFLLHFRSAFVAVFTLPMGILISFIFMEKQGLNANIMSLGGIAIAIGAMVDASIVMIENAHKQMEKYGETKEHWQIILGASKQVGPALFFSLLIITLSFLPIFTLQAQEGRLFKPLAFTKTYAMGASAFLAITLVPVMMGYFVRPTMLPSHWSLRKQRVVSATATLSTLVLFWIGFSVFSSGSGRLLLLLSLLAALLVFILLWPQSVRKEEKNPMSRFLIWLYRPFIQFVLNHRKTTILVAILCFMTILPYNRLVVDKLESPVLKKIASTIDFLFPLEKIGGEFMPPLYEGDLLYMPTTLPGISITKAKELLQQTDKIIKQFPEVHHVFGKIGRAETATDPAPLSMLETTIMLKPEAEWRTIPVKRWFSSWPGFVRKPLSRVWPEKRTLSFEELKERLNDAVKFPGLVNAWLMPIETRIGMLSTGMKTPVGVKIMGEDLYVLTRLAQEIEAIVGDVPGAVSVYSDRTVGGYYFDYDISREKAARYGLTVGDVQDIIQSAVGGMNVTHTVEGLERYPVNVRYGREFRDSVEKMRRILVPTPSGAQIPIAQVADISLHKGPPQIKSENARKSAWVYIPLKDVDVATFVKDGKQAVEESLHLPPGYS